MLFTVKLAMELHDQLQEAVHVHAQMPKRTHCHLSHRHWQLWTASVIHLTPCMDMTGLTRELRAVCAPGAAARAPAVCSLWTAAPANADALHHGGFQNVVHLTNLGVAVRKLRLSANSIVPAPWCSIGRHRGHARAPCVTSVPEGLCLRHFLCLTKSLARCDARPPGRG
jgi:hypothetical protein